MKVQYTLANLINDLIETSKDGELGFQACAANAGTPRLKQLFYRRAGDCAMAAGELQDLVAAHGGVPEQDGSTTGAVRRFWVKIRDALIGSSDRRILEEVVRGEEAAIADYRIALNDESLPADVRAVIERQLAAIRHNLTEVETLRDAARAAEAASKPEESVADTMRRARPMHGSLLWDPEAFRADFQKRYAPTGSDYNDYLEAYRYGHEIAGRYAEVDWFTAQAEVRHAWEVGHPGRSWQDYGTAIHTAWQRHHEKA